MMRKISNKIRQDNAKMRKMEDVSSVLHPSGGRSAVGPSNNPADRGPGEVPPLGWIIPSRTQVSFPNNLFFGLKISKTRGRSSKNARAPLALFSTLRAKAR